MTREEKILSIKQHLRTEAAKKFPGDEERQNRYVWGTITNIKKRLKEK
jgi:hypothetical protein